MIDSVQFSNEERSSIGDEIPASVRYKILCERLRDEDPETYERKTSSLRSFDPEKNYESEHPLFAREFKEVEKERTDPSFSSLPVRYNEIVFIPEYEGHILACRLERTWISLDMERIYGVRYFLLDEYSGEGYQPEGVMHVTVKTSYWVESGAARVLRHTFIDGPPPISTNWRSAFPESLLTGT